MLNTLLIKATDLIGFLLNKIGYNLPIRSRFDLRLVFYHGIGDGSSPCFKYLNDETSMENFSEQISYLQKNYKLLSLEEAILTIIDGYDRDDGPFCSISFDDGLSTVYTEAFPFLKERNLTATVFVNTAVIGNCKLLWLHFLNYLIFHYGTVAVSEMLYNFRPYEISKPPTTEKALLEWCKENFNFIYEFNALDKIADLLEINIGDIAKRQNLYLDWDQIDAMTQSGFTFYSHTENHTPLSVLSHSYMKREIDKARNCMINYNQSFGRFVSFPFGMKKDYGRKAREYALSNGHEIIFEVGDGYNPPSRVKKERTFSRVSFGELDANPIILYSALEIRPLLKGTINIIRKLKY